MSSSQSDGVMTLELSGDQSLDAFNTFMEEVGFNESIENIRVTIEAESPIDLTEYITGEEIEVNGETDGGGMDLVTFEEGSRTRKLATFLYENNGDEWHTTTEIKAELDEDSEIDPDDVSQILWELSERGVMEKRPHDTDGRKKEYRLNERGLKSVAEVAS
ncbi:winged-helix domain protein [Halorubrum virus Serpecor1]|uniref:Winged-helix domain protein n=1 Tax=Halorubrum virus Serpecor1 TaxID=2721757 RepID=A0A6G9RXX4_9CAUD|nr:winged-helix domain protein [Halorubrum virus Serpecor1]QIR31208.1 winged-helix domain protein [Halorubrum virus Serpecor1]